MTPDDLLDILPDAIYMHNGQLTVCTTRERYLKAHGVDVPLLLSCIADNIEDGDEGEDIRYADAVDDYFEAIQKEETP